MAWIEIELDNVDTDELIDELEERFLNDVERKRLLDMSCGIDDSESLKAKIIEKLFEKYSINQLQELCDEKVVDTKTLSLF